MNKPEQIKRLLSPVVVAQYYLGQGTIKGNRIWYKSPFRHEKTASFLVNEKGFHDFGDSWHGDVIDFVGRYYNVDFINAMKILTNDFGLPETEKITKDLELYIKRKQEEQKQIKQNLDKWFYGIYRKLFYELQEWERIKPYLHNEALVIAINQIEKIEMLLEEFCVAKDEDMIILWKDRSKIEKTLIL